jgi:hypothetical protein
MGKEVWQMRAAVFSGYQGPEPRHLLAKGTVSDHVWSIRYRISSFAWAAMRIEKDNWVLLWILFILRKKSDTLSSVSSMSYEKWILGSFNGYKMKAFYGTYGQIIFPEKKTSGVQCWAFKCVQDIFLFNFMALTYSNSISPCAWENWV